LGIACFIGFCDTKSSSKERTLVNSILLQFLKR
jgi:hypothetical protein